MAVVVRGDFKPVTISPAWLRDQELIGEPEHTESAFEVLIPNEVAVFKASWLNCHASPEALQFHTDQQAEVERLRDLVVGMLRIWGDKPISLLGINRHVHFSVANFDQWNAIGDSVVRNDMWGNALSIPGMRSVTYWGERTDTYAGRIQVQIEPSFVAPPGVYVAYNDHYDLTIVESQPKTREEARRLDRRENADATKDKIPVAIEILTNQWEVSFQRSVSILEQVWQQARI